MPEPAVNEGEAVKSTKESRNRSNPSRHSRLCVICNHPDRAAIEFDFLNWRNPGDLVKGYRFRGLSTIYRHAHATGLFAKRRLNLRFAMERIVERVNEVPVTANAVIRAARAIARINDSGEWVDPPTRVIVTHITRVEDCEAPSVGDAEASPASRRRDRMKITAGSARSSLRASTRLCPALLSFSIKTFSTSHPIPPPPSFRESMASPRHLKSSSNSLPNSQGAAKNAAAPSKPTARPAPHRPLVAAGPPRQLHLKQKMCLRLLLCCRRRHF